MVCDNNSLSRQLNNSCSEGIADIERCLKLQLAKSTLETRLILSYLSGEGLIKLFMDCVYHKSRRIFKTLHNTTSFMKNQWKLHNSTQTFYVAQSDYWK